MGSPRLRKLRKLRKAKQPTQTEVEKAPEEVVVEKVVDTDEVETKKSTPKKKKSLWSKKTSE
tara:strand:+ start:5791 stop:5976 length:186 start_codon:yes stop_codon:yes gene_type:complete